MSPISSDANAKKISDPIFACIDMGTNSFHMLIAKPCHEGNGFEIVHREKESVPFFRQSLTEHYLDAQAISNAIWILKDMKDKAHERGAQKVLAVATSAVRESKNGHVFIEGLQEELNIDAHIISGKEEARLIYLGVIQSMANLKGQFAIVDIGGGSTEIIVGNRKDLSFSESYKLGSARLTAEFLHGQVDKRKLKNLHDAVYGLLEPASTKIEEVGGFKKLIGTSGTIAALTKLNQAIHGHPYEERQGSVTTISELENIVAYLEDCTIKGEKFRGVSPDRRQTILAGAIVLLETMRCLHAQEITYCSSALREGVIINYFLESGFIKSELEEHKIIKKKSIFALLEKYKANFAHAHRVTYFANSIFQQSKLILHNYGAQENELLYASAMLHDIGTFIGRKGHHKHSAYLISNSGLLGYFEDEIELISQIARYHRGSEPKIGHQSYAQISAAKQKKVAELSAILRLAEALDRSHQQLIDDIELRPKDNPKQERLQLELTLFPKPNANLQAELWAVEQKKIVFEKQFNVKLNTKIATAVAKT